MADKPSHVQVEIFGQSYAVKAGADPGYVEQLAAYVDSKMQEMSRSSGAVDSVRIAVLAALTLADECFQLKNQSGEAEDKAQKRAAESIRARAEALVRELDAVLAD